MSEACGVLLRCSRCDAKKPADEFHRKATNTHRQGRNYYCKPCNRAYQNERYTLNPLRQRNAVRKYKYGMTSDDYARLLAEQSGHCATCEAIVGDGRGRPLHVDHDHTTGKVRGLMCGDCNRALGLIHDDANRALALAAYLIPHEEVIHVPV